MKIEIKQYEPSHAVYIIENYPRSRELYWCKCEDWGKWIIEWAEKGPSYTLFIDSQIVMCAGVVIIRRGIGEAWMILSSLFYKYIKECFRVVRDKLNEIIEEENLRRVQAIVVTDFPQAEHWLNHLGFENETPIPRGLKSFGPMGEDMLVFGRDCR